MSLFKERPARGEASEDADKAVGKPTDHRTTVKDLKVGDTAHIVDYLHETEAVRKVEAMGLRRGKKITIMQKLGRGIVVKTSNSRIVITSDVAKSIEVK
jgi:ferrous iron transport protein A